jgi:hypothetical protein
MFHVHVFFPLLFASCRHYTDDYAVSLKVNTNTFICLHMHAIFNLISLKFDWQKGMHSCESIKISLDWEKPRPDTF